MAFFPDPSQLCCPDDAGDRRIGWFGSGGSAAGKREISAGGAVSMNVRRTAAGRIGVVRDKEAAGHGKKRIGRLMIFETTLDPLATKRRCRRNISKKQAPKRHGKRLGGKMKESKWVAQIIELFRLSKGIKSRCSMSDRKFARAHYPESLFKNWRQNSFADRFTSRLLQFRPLL
jgi:hypothetical protein